jgi:hypothetical protein
MNVQIKAALLAGASLLATSGRCQQAQAPVVAVLQGSLTAMIGRTPIQDVTLTGSVTDSSGSKPSIGTVTARAIFPGNSRVDFSLAGGTLSEVRMKSASGITGSWTMGDGVMHPIPQHNLMTESAWFFPVFALNNLLTNPAMAINYVGQEGTLVHFIAYEIPTAASPDVAATTKHLSQIDVYLDAATLLPSKLSFNVHPDNNALLDLPIDVQFSNYQTVNGVNLPFHIQKFLNRALISDLQIQSATFNTGLTATAISAQ